MYRIIIRPILFLLDPEKVHNLLFFFFRILQKTPFCVVILKKTYAFHKANHTKKLFGITFPNPIGLAAGLDKNAEVVDVLDAFGFGFIEIGTLTPIGQPGNPKKRIFRLPKDHALINRMGFNNQGLESAVKRLKKRKSKVIIGGNIGKNKNTPNEEATNDYLLGYQMLFDVVDYFVVNVSSPNTPNLRDLQEKEPLTHLLLALQKENQKKTNPKPILLKIAPDLSDNQLLDIINIVKTTKIAGVIATNTTLSREGLRTDKDNIQAIDAGGLSGKPLAKRSTEVIRFLAEKSGKSFPIIGVGGIHTPQDALEKMDAGADLIQLYTGFIYEGPGLIKKILKSI